MLGFLQYLIAVIIVQAAMTSPDVPARPDWTAIGVTLAGFALAARIAGRVLAVRTDASGRIGALLFTWNAARGAALAAFHLVTVHFGGVRIPSDLGISGWVLVPHVLQFAPFFALTAGLVWGLHPATRAAQVGSRTWSGAVLAEFRGALLPLAPLVILASLGDLLDLASPGGWVGRARNVLAALPATKVLLLLGLVFGALLVIPFVLRIAWRARPLPDGPLRQRLEAYSRRAGFRARDILVWPTGGDVLNAAVLGALPRFRYVLITDALLHTLDEDEIEAVFAHEVGHARRGHVLLFFGFTAVLSLLALVPGIAGIVNAAMSPLSPLLRTIVIVLVWIGVVFGWVSRRFEQEADVYGIETLPRPTEDGPHPFARALERIGAEVGAIREVTGWRHFSIADRVEFVRQYLAYPEVRRAYRRSIGALRWTLYLVIGGFGLAAALRIPAEFELARNLWPMSDPSAQGRAWQLGQAAQRALLGGRQEDAARWMREAAALEPLEPGDVQFYAVLLQGSGRPLGARLLWEELAAREDLPAGTREAARRFAEALAPR